MPQLNLFQRGEDLPLLNQPPPSLIPTEYCDICDRGLYPPAVSLCRQCADEQIADLNESYKARGISWEVYTQGVNTCLERSGRLPR